MDQQKELRLAHQRMQENGGGGFGDYIVITFDFYVLVELYVKLFSFLVR